EPHVAAPRALEPRHDIGGDRLIGVADMRTAIGVADRGGDVERFIIFGHGRALAAGAGEGKYPSSPRRRGPLATSHHTDSGPRLRGGDDYLGRGASSARQLPISKPTIAPS